jgi:hypothetical protein
MADNDEQLEIELNDEKKAPESDIQVEKVDNDDKKAEVEADEGINDLKMKLEQERQARIQAEKQAHMAAQAAAEAKNEVQDTNLQLVKNAIDTVKRNNDVLKYNYSEAMAVGDYTKAAEIQETLGMNSAKLMELERGRQHMETAPKYEAPQPQAPSDPVEALASQLSPRSAQWIRRNPHFATDARLYQKMVAAHNIAMADGHSPDTDDYFASIEDTLRISKPVAVEAEDPMAGAAKVTQRRAPPAAPVTRSGTGTGSRPNVVRLTKAEAETARDLGMTEEDYARNKLLLQKEGRLN